MARGFRAMAEQMKERDRAGEPHREKVTGQRLAAIITAAASRMSRMERMQLWRECWELLHDRLDKETHPELCAAINALPDELPKDVQASRWN